MHKFVSDYLTMIHAKGLDVEAVPWSNSPGTPGCNIDFVIRAPVLRLNYVLDTLLRRAKPFEWGYEVVNIESEEIWAWVKFRLVWEGVREQPDTKPVP